MNSSAVDLRSVQNRLHLTNADLLVLVFLLIYLGTIAEGAPIIPISAQLKYNIDAVCEYVVKKIPVPIRDFTSEPRLIGENSASSRFFI